MCYIFKKQEVRMLNQLFLQKLEASGIRKIL
jgi:hypothetical protein